MIIQLSKDERDTLLMWKEMSKRTGDHFGGGEAIFPEEERLAAALRAHPGGKFEIKDSLLVVCLSWAEAGVDPHFGGGAITNPVEKELLKKLKALDTDKGAPPSPGPAPAKTPNFDSLVPDFENRGGRKAKLWGVVIAAAILAVAFHLTTGKDKKEPAQAPAPLPDNIRVEYSVGEVLIKSGESWVPVTVGGQVMLSDSLRTSAASKVVLDAAGRKIEVSESRAVLVKELF